MPENFTDAARRALLLATEEAERFGQNFVGTEHLLLGLIEARDGLAAIVLRSLDIDEPRVRAEMEKNLPVPAASATSDQPTQTPRTRKAIDYAREEARALHHDSLDTGHLLLGLLREREGMAAQMLAHFGISLDTLRRIILERLREPSQPAEPETEAARTDTRDEAAAHPPATPSLYDRFTGQARRVILLAHREALRFGRDYLGTEHILLGVLQESSGRVAALLHASGVAAETIRLALERSATQGPEVAIGAKLPLTPPARRALQFAGEESLRLQHARVGPEHLLLGLLHEPEGEAAQVLLQMGLDLDRLRAETLRLPPAEDRDLMLQSSADASTARLMDPSVGELEWLVSASNVPASASVSRTRPQTSAEPLLTKPSAASAEGLAVHLRFTQLVLGALAGGLSGALLHGRTGALIGILAGITVASARSTALGVVMGVFAGMLVATSRAPRSPGMQMLAIFVGALIGCCFGDFLKNFASEEPPKDRGGSAGPE